MKSNATSQEFCFSKISPNAFFGFDKGGNLNFTSFDFKPDVEVRGYSLKHSRGKTGAFAARAPLWSALFLFSLGPLHHPWISSSNVSSYPFVGRGVVHCLKFK